MVCADNCLLLTTGLEQQYKTLATGQEYTREQQLLVQQLHLWCRTGTAGEALTRVVHSLKAPVTHAPPTISSTNGHSLLEPHSRSFSLLVLAHTSYHLLPITSQLSMHLKIHFLSSALYQTQAKTIPISSHLKG